MPKYKAKVIFTFEGDVVLRAKNRTQAEEILEKHFGGCNMQFQTTVEDMDWEFPVHPKKSIQSITKDK